MKPKRPMSLASEDEARDDLILRRYGSHADDDSAPRERTALSRTKLRDGDDDDARGPTRHGRATDSKRAGPRR